ncbi:non-ltr retroelement reverse transcriptase [Hordeum vulgare]|nr:non-ltr retroelement reverse transcriptase [Hordeum vulgare]
MCFKCGRKGHYQVMYASEPLCFVWKQEGHTSNNSPSRQAKPELVMYGFGVKGQGFYLLEDGVEEEVVLPANDASLVVTVGDAMEESIRRDLNNMWDSDWDWQLVDVRKNCFWWCIRPKKSDEDVQEKQEDHVTDQ